MRSRFGRCFLIEEEQGEGFIFLQIFAIFDCYPAIAPRFWTVVAVFLDASLYIYASIGNTGLTYGENCSGVLMIRQRVKLRP